MKTLLYAVCLGVLFIQCKKEELSTTPIIKEIKTDGKTSEIFLYNTDKQLIEHQILFNDGINIMDSWRYDWQNEVVIKMEYWSSHPLYLSSSPVAGKPMTLQNIEKYTYDKNKKLIKSEYFRDEKSALITYGTYQYDNNGRRLAKSIFLPNGQQNIIDNYVLSSDGNIIKSGSSNWTYDNSKNPFAGLNIPEPANTSWRSLNNPLSNYGIDAQGRKYNMIKYSYTYDAVSGLPIKAKLNSESRAEQIIEFTYQ